MERFHRSVMLSEVLQYLDVKPGGIYADFTFGEGGHSEAILEKGAERLVAVDRDAEAVGLYRREGKYRDDPRLKLQHMRMSQFPYDQHQGEFDGILVDLGVSTRQLLQPQRGFSFAETGPLDMRMDPSEEGSTLADALEGMSAEDLARALWENTDLKHSRSTARRILDAYHSGKLSDTSQLARLFGGRPGKSHPATVPFLALRMLVNQELYEINEGIPKLVDCLKPGGRLAVITFHSTEDRAVKRIFALLAGRCICGERLCRCPRQERVSLVLRKPLLASAEELAENPRARSAKLRCVEKIVSGH